MDMGRPETSRRHHFLTMPATKRLFSNQRNKIFEIYDFNSRERICHEGVSGVNGQGVLGSFVMTVLPARTRYFYLSIGALIGATGSSVFLYRRLSENPLDGPANPAIAHPADLEPASSPQERVQHLPMIRKSWRQRIKDSIERRREQHKFPFRKRGAPVASTDGLSKGLPATRDVAASNPAILSRIRRKSEEILQEPLLDRFDNVEIARYAIHYGLLRTSTEAGQQMVVQDAVDGLVDSQRWFQYHTFASIDDMQKSEYSGLIWWGYDCGENKRPVLHVDIGKAVEVCTGQKALEFANIVITMMELAVSNSPYAGIPNISNKNPVDRIDVEIYAKGTNTINASRAFWILRAVVKTMSHHYPGRLNELVLYDLPVVLNWIVLGVKKILHPDTARKVLSKQGK